LKLFLPELSIAATIIHFDIDVTQPEILDDRKITRTKKCSVMKHGAL